jgi:calcineurin-like phosphoesterase family protein
MKQLNIFFSAHTHFFHDNIIKYSRRPFANVDEMNTAIIDNWNTTVGPTDIVYLLGDLTLNDVNYARKYF